MKSLESMERETPEFQSLTQDQQNERRMLFYPLLSKIIGEPLSLGITKEQIAGATGDILELHLTGRIEKHIDPPRTRKK